MNRRNYAKELNRIIENSGGIKPRLLLHCCCGPCATSVLESLAQHFNITALWYNPNLYPESEFSLRLETLKEVIKKLGLEEKVNLIELPWDHNAYTDFVKGLEQEKEGGSRCSACFTLRLRETAKTAKQLGFDYFCSTLTVSRHKDAVLINSIGEELAAQYGVLWLPSDFKKNSGENRSAELSGQLGIYRQLYCGCEFSLEARNRGRDENK